MVTNLSIEKLQQKLNSAVEEFRSLDNNLKQAKEQVDALERAVEQCRGRVAMLDDLIKESSANQEENGKVEDGDVVLDEKTIEGTAVEKDASS